MIELILYTGPQCSLCDQAEALLMQSDRTYSLTKQNIREDTQLYHLYGARIPVVKRIDTAQEIGWPFSLDELNRFLQ